MAGVERHGEGKACEVWAWEAWAVEWEVRGCWGGCCRGTRQSLAKELPVAGATPAGHSEYRQKEPTPRKGCSRGGLRAWSGRCCSGAQAGGGWPMEERAPPCQCGRCNLRVRALGGWLASRHTP